MEKTTINLIREGCEIEVQGYKAIIDDVPLVIHKHTRYSDCWDVSEPRTGISLCSTPRKTRELTLLEVKNKVKFELSRSCTPDSLEVMIQFVLEQKEVT